MATGKTHIWAHGNAVQFNQKEADQKNVGVSYTSNGFEISPPQREITDDNRLFRVFLPITIPSAISDALTAFERLRFHFSTPPGIANIINLRLMRNSGIKFELFDLSNDLPLKGDLINNGMGWGPSTSTLTQVGLFLCLEITIQFENPTNDPNDKVIIAGAGVILQHKKFDYE